MTTIEDIKRLREQTGAGFAAVKEALDQANGNFDEAIKILRQKGMAKSDKRQAKVAAHGVIGTYIHTNNRLVTIVEVVCETDFAANSPDLLKFANDLALHITAAKPEYITESGVSEEVISDIKASFIADLEGDPENEKESKVDVVISKFYQEKVLIHQKFVLDESKTIADLLNELVVKIGEKVVITRFVRAEVNGEFKLFS